MSELATHFCNECGNNMCYDAGKDKVFCPIGHEAGSRGSWYRTVYADKKISLEKLKEFCKKNYITVKYNVASISFDGVGFGRTDDDEYVVAQVLSVISRKGKLYTDRLKEFVLNTH